MRFSRFNLRSRKMSVNKMIISRAELKHTNDKVIITIYVYNRQKKQYINMMRQIDTLGLQKKKNNNLLHIIKSKCLSITRKIIQQRKILIKTLNVKFIENTINNNYKDYYDKKYLSNYLIKCLHKQVLYIFFKQSLFFNKSKFNHYYILPLTNLIKTFYNKKVEFNLVNLKYLYLNSYILTQTIVTKIRNRDNKILNVLTAALMMINLPHIDKLRFYNDMYNRTTKIQNLMVNQLLCNPVLHKLKGKGKINNSDSLNLVLNTMFNKNLLLKKLPEEKQTEYVTNTVLRYVKNKYVTGIKLQGAGRLTRRFVAERAILKKNQIGNLKNIDSSYKGLSTVIFKGYSNSNLQYTILTSKRRMGSFGIKG